MIKESSAEPVSLGAYASPEQIRLGMRELGQATRKAARWLATAPAGLKNKALLEAAQVLRRRGPDILAANALDLADGRALSATFLERLTLDADRVEAMAGGLEEIAALPIRSAGCWQLSSDPMASVSNGSRHPWG